MLLVSVIVFVILLLGALIGGVTFIALSSQTSSLENNVTTWPTTNSHNQTESTPRTNVITFTNMPGESVTAPPAGESATPPNATAPPAGESATPPNATAPPVNASVTAPHDVTNVSTVYSRPSYKSFVVAVYLPINQWTDTSTMEKDTIGWEHSSVTDIILFPAITYVNETPSIQAEYLLKMDVIISWARRWRKRLLLSCSGSFSTVVTQLTPKLAENIINFALEKNLDGVDFDYEYPSSAEDQKKLQIFLTAARFYINRIAPQLTLTATVAPKSWMSSPTGVLSKEFLDYNLLDWLGFMSYGPGYVNSLNHLSTTITEYTVTKSWPALKMMAGIPWYGHNGSIIPCYKNIVKQLPLNDTTTYIFNYTSNSGVSVMIQFDSVKTLTEKMKWIVDSGFGGVIVWQGWCDVEYGHPQSLLSAMDRVLLTNNSVTTVSSSDVAPTPQNSCGWTSWKSMSDHYSTTKMSKVAQCTKLASAYQCITANGNYSQCDGLQCGTTCDNVNFRVNCCTTDFEVYLYRRIASYVKPDGFVASTVGYEKTISHFIFFAMPASTNGTLKYADIPLDTALAMTGWCNRMGIKCLFGYLFEMQYFSNAIATNSTLLAINMISLALDVYKADGLLIHATGITTLNYRSQLQSLISIIRQKMPIGKLFDVSILPQALSLIEGGDLTTGFMQQMMLDRVLIRTQGRGEVLQGESFMHSAVTNLTIALNHTRNVIPSLPLFGSSSTSTLFKCYVDLVPLLTSGDITTNVVSVKNSNNVTETLYFNNKDMLGRKAKWLRDNGYRGLSIWEADCDYPMNAHESAIALIGTTLA